MQNLEGIDMAEEIHLETSEKEENPRKARGWYCEGSPGRTERLDECAQRLGLNSRTKALDFITAFFIRVHERRQSFANSWLSEKEIVGVIGDRNRYELWRKGI